MSRGTEIDPAPDMRAPVTLNNKRKHNVVLKNGTRVLARLKEEDEFAPATVVHQGYSQGRWYRGFGIRFDSGGDIQVIDYEAIDRLIKEQ